MSTAARYWISQPVSTADRSLWMAGCRILAPLVPNARGTRAESHYWRREVSMRRR